MARKRPAETEFGPAKYAAFHLLLGVWIRRHVGSGSCVYVTLGGTELRDIQSLAFINQALASSIYSFEDTEDRFQLACVSRDRLKGLGINVECIPESIFAYQRRSDDRHLFFLDFSRCRPARRDLHRTFRRHAARVAARAALFCEASSPNRE